MEIKTEKEEENKGEMVTWELACCPQEGSKHTGETSHS